MADLSQQAAISAELATLHARHLEELRNATFTGWTPELLAAREKLEGRMRDLRRQLASLLEDKPQ